jgi:PST family polysaccharide transporter
MIGFGAFIVGSDFLNAFVRNVPQVLMGWLAGASQLGLYNKAYQLLMLPMNQIYSPIGRVVAPALSRLQSDRDRVRRYYLDAYTLVVSTTLPISAVAAVFATEVVTVLLGSQWIAAAAIFKYLAIAGAFIAVMRPTGWFLVATGRTRRFFMLDFFEVPIVLVACAVGVQYGAEGLALGFAIARGVECVPLIYLVFRETEIAPRDIWKAVIGPYVGVACAVVAGLSVNVWLTPHLTPLPRLCVGSAISLIAYAVILLGVFGNWSRFRDLIEMIFRGAWMTESAAVKSNAGG